MVDSCWAQRPLGVTSVPLGWPLGVVKITPLRQNNIAFQHKNINESIWMSAESYGGLIWGSKALRGNLSPPGVAPRGVKNQP